MNRRTVDISPPRKRLPLMTLGPAHYVLILAGVLLVLFFVWFSSIRLLT